MLKREDLRRAVAALFVPVSLAAAWAFASSLTKMPADRRAQRADAGGALAVVFADARNLLSHSLLMKADSYFHGGIDKRTVMLERERWLAKRAEAEYDHDHDHDHEHDHHGCGCEHCGETEGSAFTPTRNPLRWIADGIDAPRQHKHLEQEETAEMLPLIWAAAKADPGNSEAWSTAWYVINYYLKNSEQAKKVLDEALGLNPDSVELRFLYGETYWHFGKGDMAAAEKWFAEALEVALAKSGGRLQELPEKEAYNCKLSMTMLSSILRERGDGEALERLRGATLGFGEGNFAHTAVTNAQAMLSARLRGKAGEVR